MGKITNKYDLTEGQRFEIEAAMRVYKVTLEEAVEAYNKSLDIVPKYHTDEEVEEFLKNL